MSPAVWAITVIAVFSVYVFEYVMAARRPHVVQPKEAAIGVSIYVAAAIAFGAALWVFASPGKGAEFFAGWITEYSLSVDNLFVFIVIMGSFAVPTLYQQKILQIGILGALILRFAFILVGAALLNAFWWMFFVFGAFLIYTAYKLATTHEGDTDPTKGRLIQTLQKFLPMTPTYHEGKYSIKMSGRRVFTPLLLVIVAIFVTDLVFALDSIPAIFGITTDPYIVFTANAFALMGLRQLYFLVDGLLDRLVYLSYGLSLILAFIGVKMIMHAAHEAGWEVPEVPTWLSLIVILVILATTVILSLTVGRTRKRASG
ncbi:MAG: TerC/Alx family metal homeostasis membrane protein [Actinobacteria bacterium]|nr:TerC/Alx family metal homeostasis membrane protein [Actinomycetota bacterium]